MGALMLVFVLSLAGESATMAVAFDSMKLCEEARATIIEKAKNTRTPSGAPISLIATVCTIPVEVEII